MTKMQLVGYIATVLNELRLQDERLTREDVVPREVSFSDPSWILNPSLHL